MKLIAMKPVLFCIFFVVLNGCDILPSNNTIYRSNSSSSNEKGEFDMLMEKDKINKIKVNAEVVTYLLNETQAQDKMTAVVVDNNSNCDLILRLVEIRTNQIYNLPVPKNSKNQFVLKKGNYTLKSNVCTAKYYSQKYITEPLILALSNR